MGFLLRTKSPQVKILAFVHDVRLPALFLPAMPSHALQGAPSLLGVCAILRPGRLPKICNTVIRSIPINVIEIPFWKTPMREEPSETGSSILVAVYADVPISEIAHMSGRFARGCVGSAFAPEKFPCRCVIP